MRVPIMSKTIQIKSKWFRYPNIIQTSTPLRQIKISHSFIKCLRLNLITWVRIVKLKQIGNYYYPITLGKISQSIKKQKRVPYWTSKRIGLVNLKEIIKSLISCIR